MPAFMTRRTIGRLLFLLLWLVLFGTLLQRELFVKQIDLREAQVIKQAQETDFLAIYFHNQRIGYVKNHLAANPETSGFTLAQDAILHLNKDEHYVSTSTTILYDGHHNVEGYLFLGRDVTKMNNSAASSGVSSKALNAPRGGVLNPSCAIKNLERKYNRIRRWLVPSFVAVGLLLGALFFSIPHFSKGVRILDHKKQTFRDRIYSDYQKLRTELSTMPAGNDRARPHRILLEYFAGNDAAYYCINGLVLLGRDKQVVNAYSPQATDGSVSLIGTTYSGIKFRGPEEARYKLLSLFRTNKDHPMGVKGVEIAFELQLSPDSPGWLLFQLDSDKLEQEFGMDEDILAKIDFPRQ